MLHDSCTGYIDAKILTTVVDFVKCTVIIMLDYPGLGQIQNS